MKTWQRYWAFVLVSVEAALFAYLSNDHIFPAAVIVFTAFGIAGRVQFELTGFRRILASAVIAAFLGAYWRTADSADSYTSSLFLGPVGHPLILYLMTLQAGRMYIRDARGLGASYPALGVVVMVCIGDLFTIEANQEEAYRAAALVFIVALCAYLSAPPDQAPKNSRATVLPHVRVTALLIAVVAFASWLSALLIFQNHQKLDQAYALMLQNVSPQDDIGFGSRARLDNMSNIRLDDSMETMLRIYADEPPMYLRGKAYDTLSRSEWTEDSNFTVLYPLAAPKALPGAAPFENTFRIRTIPVNDTAPLHVWPVGVFPQTVFTRLDTAWVGIDTPRLDRNTHDTVKTPLEVGELPYRAYAGEPLDVRELPDRVRKRLVRVPPSYDPEVDALATRLFADRVTPEEKIAAVVQYFHENYTYEIGIFIPPFSDPISYFLLERPAAHCEFFASGAVFLLRLAGVPARYVTGFVVTEYNPVAGYWVARSRDAHAWAEAYVPGKGWVTVEATPADGVPHSEESSRFSYWWDSFRQRAWEYRRAAMGGAYDFVVQRLPEWLMPIATVGVPLLALATALFAWSYWVRPRTPKARKTGGPRLNHLLYTADGIARKRGYERRTTQTLHRFAQFLESEAEPPLPQLANWYRDFAHARFKGQVSEGRLAAIAESLQEVLKQPAEPAQPIH